VRSGSRRIFILSAMAPLIAAAGGCAFPLHDSLFAAPGKFDSLDCASIASSVKTATAREEKLNELIERDNPGAGGTGVNTLIYQDDLNTVREDLTGLRQASDAKHCPPLIAPAQ
jgi:hypothetical protein